MRASIGLVFALAVLPAPALAAPPATPSNGIVACFKVDNAGGIEAYVWQSSGNPARDEELLSEARKLLWGDHFPKQKRNRWTPLVIGDEGAPLPAPPARCGPPPAGKTT